MDTSVSLNRRQQGEEAEAGVGVVFLWALCRHLTLLISLMLSKCAPMMFWVVLITHCRALLSWAMQETWQFVMFPVRMLESPTLINPQTLSVGRVIEQHPTDKNKRKWTAWRPRGHSVTVFSFLHAKPQKMKSLWRSVHWCTSSQIKVITASHSCSLGAISASGSFTWTFTHSWGSCPRRH